MTLSELVYAARCWPCIPQSQQDAVAIYDGVTITNGEPPPPPEGTVLGNPDLLIIFGDPNAGIEFGVP